SKALAPEPFGKLYQRSVYQTMRNKTGQLSRRLEKELRRLTEPAHAEARRFLAQEGTLLRRFRGVLNQSLGGQRIRAHGEFHLGRVLYTGKDFVVMDFEG